MLALISVQVTAQTPIRGVRTSQWSSYAAVDGSFQSDEEPKTACGWPKGSEPPPCSHNVRCQYSAEYPVLD